MNRHHKLLQNEELYSQSVDMIKSSIRGMQQEINPIKKFLGDRRKEIVKQISTDTNRRIDRYSSLEFTRSFYEYTLKELAEIERACEECLVRLNIDFLTAIKGRMRPPSYLTVEEIGRAYKMSCDVFDGTKEDKTFCRCTWENKPVSNLDDTQDIILKPRDMTRTEFDEYDLKFRQEIVYLRTKMFSLPKKRIDVESGIEILSGGGIKESSKTSEFIQTLKEKETPDVFSVRHELSKINSLKFIDAKFVACDVWTKTLDVHGEQFGSKWHLVLRPQIEIVARKRMMPILHLNPNATFDFISTITKFTNFILVRTDLIGLLQDKSDAVWLNSWNLQFQTMEGKNIAATMIQALWRGYWLRKKKSYSECLYIAASVLWFCWLSVRERKNVHRRYLKKMQISQQITRELTLKLSEEYHSMIEEPHVVVHLPSIGHPVDLRRILNPKLFAIYQNITILRICLVHNPRTEVVYILPVKPTEDLLMMYSDFIESISPDEGVAKRITFIALSQADTFKNRPLNVSRILHCSEESLNEIKRKIANKPAYFLPNIVDECDMKLTDILKIPLLSPDMELQRQFLNASIMSETIDSLGLLQPPHKGHITNYETLCSSLSELMVLHTEVSVWMFKLNYGMTTKYSGFFLINHISVPFMPMLRREREKHGDLWKVESSLREEYLERMKDHLPKVIPNVTRLSKVYKSWKHFCGHMKKFGCLLQAVPAEMNPKTIVVSLFVPGRVTKEQPKWLGTADKISLETAYSSSIYMLPQTSLDIVLIQPTVNKLAKSMQNKGYFGYLSIECYCYMHKQEDKLLILLLNVFPYYSYTQNYIDWMKFATGGWYNDLKDQFLSDISTTLHSDRRKSSFLFAEKTPEWHETAGRYAVAITQLHHSRFCTFRWSNLKNLFEACNIVYDRKKRQGSSIILHDGEVRNFGKMVTVSSSMTTTLTMVHKNLTKLHQTLMIDSKRKAETNLPSLIDFFAKLSLDYRNLSIDKCSPNF
ncbi:IQ motif-containing protein H [Xylocopa sonorina]|uniref:IQ motif-containing protein H n=1 Tax=Xylocopa sonorina TaxID=1818115 RepID=UPI00403AD87A